MSRRLGAALLAAALLLLGGCAAQAPATQSGRLRALCFSAGKADAILLTTARSAVLIDAGESGFGKEIVSELKAQGVSSLDYLILTHFDKDHIGGAAKVLKSVPVGAVLQSDCPKDSAEYQKYIAALDAAALTPTTVREAVTFTLDGAVYTVDPPRETDYAVDPSNNSSLIVSVAYGEQRLLFAGDAEDARLAEFLDTDGGTYDLLKVPYHGRWQEGLPDFLSAVRPAYAVITCSEEEPEDARTVSALAEIDAEVYLTRTGAVLAECDGTTLTVQYR